MYDGKNHLTFTAPVGHRTTCTPPFNLCTCARVHPHKFSIRSLTSFIDLYPLFSIHLILGALANNFMFLPMCFLMFDAAIFGTFASTANFEFRFLTCFGATWQSTNVKFCNFFIFGVFFLKLPFGWVDLWHLPHCPLTSLHVLLGIVVGVRGHGYLVGFHSLFKPARSLQCQTP